MSPWGTGTKDSPIVLDEDSGDELVTETYDPIYRTPSPRPRTFLSAMQVPRLSEASARTLQQFKEDLQQQVLIGKRKREPDPDSINNLKHGNHMASPLNNQAGLSPTKQESRKQRKLRLRLEREAKAEEEAGQDEQEPTPSLPLPATKNRHHHQISHPQASSSVSTSSPETRQRKRTKHTPQIPNELAAPAPNPESTSISPTPISSNTSFMIVPVAINPSLPPKPPFGILPTTANDTKRLRPQFGFSGFPGVSLGSFGATSSTRPPEVPFNTLSSSPTMPPPVTNPIQNASSTLSATLPVATKPSLPSKLPFGIIPTPPNETTRLGPQFGFSGFPGVPLGSFGATSSTRSSEVPFNTLSSSPVMLPPVTKPTQSAFSVSATPSFPTKPLLPPKPRFGTLPTLANETTRPGSQSGLSAFPSAPQASGSFGTISTTRSPMTPSNQNTSYSSPSLESNPVVRQSDKPANSPRRNRRLPPPLPLKRPPNPEKLFSLRQEVRSQVMGPTSSNLTPIYVPIGKPDFRCNHGIFPILPIASLSKPPNNHPSTSAAADDLHESNYYSPTLGNTLVMENIPADLCDDNWISNWSRSACGVDPIKIIFGPMRALIEYASSEIAVAAWASPKLGVDEFGRNNTVNKKLKEFAITVYWWRPDKEGEKKLLKIWGVWKKQVSEEMRKAVTDKLQQLEAESKYGVEKAGLNGVMAVGDGKEFEAGTAATIINGTYEAFHAMQQVKNELVGVAKQLGFEGRLKDLVKAGVPEEEISRWEQREIARVERRLRVMKRQHTMGEDVWRREDDGALKVNAYNTREKVEVGGEKRKKRRGSKNGRKNRFEGERKATNTGLPPRPLVISYPKATAEPSGKSEPAPPRFPAPNTASPTFLPTSTITTASSSPTNTPYPSPFSLTFSASSSASLSSSNNHGNSQLLFGLDKTRAGAGPSLCSPIPSTSIPTTTFTSSAYAPVFSPSSAVGSKFPVSEKPPISVFPQISPTNTSPHQLGTTPSVVPLSPQIPPTLSQPPNPRKRKLTSPEPTVINQDSAAKKLRGFDSVKEPTTQAQSPTVLSVSRIPSCTLSDAPAAPITTVAAATTPTLTAETSIAGSTGSITPRRTAEDKLVGRSSLCSPMPASGSGAGALTSTIVIPVEAKVTQSSTLETAQGTVETTRGSMAPSPTNSGSNAPETSVSVVVPDGVSPDDMDTSSAFEQDKSIKLATSTAASTTTKNPTTTQQLQSQRVSTSIPRPNISTAVLEALKTVMTKPVGERQQFLDGEFKMTKALMANLETATKDRKKRIIKIWKEKIRIINEVTKSIKNDNRVWYSHEVQAWIRMQWPSSLDNAGVLVVSDDEE